MPNMSLKKHEMPTQAPDVRNHNFDEVALGYTAETAVEEAQRCLHCKNKPCVGGCPVRIYIPEFIAKVAEGAFEEARVVLAISEAVYFRGTVSGRLSECQTHSPVALSI